MESNKKPAFLLAARRKVINGIKYITLVYVGSGYSREIEEEKLNAVGIRLGMWVHAEERQREWYNFKQTKHTANVKINVQGDIAYIENVSSWAEYIEKETIFANKLFPYAVCQDPRFVDNARYHNVRVYLLETPVVIGENCMFFGATLASTPITTHKPLTPIQQLLPPRPESPAFSVVSSTHLPQPNIDLMSYKQALTQKPSEYEPENVIQSWVVESSSEKRALFWAAKRKFDEDEGTPLLACISLGTYKIYRVDEQKMINIGILLGSFFYANVDGEELDEFDKEVPPMDYFSTTVGGTAYLENLKSIAQTIEGKCVLLHKVLGLSSSPDNSLEGEYAHRLFLRNKPEKIGNTMVYFQASDLKKVSKRYMALVLTYTEKDGIRTHEVQIFENKIKLQFVNKGIKLEKNHVFVGQFEETSSGWKCREYEKELKTDIEICEEEGRFYVKLNVEKF